MAQLTAVLGRLGGALLELFPLTEQVSSRKFKPTSETWDLKRASTVASGSALCWDAPVPVILARAQGYSSRSRSQPEGQEQYFLTLPWTKVRIKAGPQG